MLCPWCRNEMVDVGRDWLDQSVLTRIPARRLVCPKCPDPVIHLEPTGESWEAYPCAKVTTNG